MTPENPDTIHGRMKEGAHLAGYGLKRAMENLKYLLEEERWKQLSPSYGNVNQFLRDTSSAFQLLKIEPTERKEIARLVKEAEPDASQRAIADMVGASHVQVGRDLGKDYSGTNVTDDTVKEPETGTDVTPQPWTTRDDYDPAAPDKRGEKYYQSSKDMGWSTPQWLFDLLDDEFGFEVDVCASPSNHKCKRYFSKEDNGLLQQWEGICWMNPPYGNEISDWMKKARASADSGATVVCLVPARTDTGWWFDNCTRSEVRFLKGRISFEGAGPAPFPSAIVVMRAEDGKSSVVNRGELKWWTMR